MSRILVAAIVISFNISPLFAADAPTAATSAPATAPAAKAHKKPATSASADGFRTEDERTFYSYGFKIGQQMAQFGMSEGEASAISQGLRDSISGKTPKVNVSVYLPKVGEMAQKRVGAKAEAMKVKGRAYSDAFAKEDGVKAIPNGGFIKTLTPGTGSLPSPDDTVKVNYRGTLTDGTEFDSSYKRNEPTSFPLKNVIPCWTNGVAMMKVGGKAKLVCPSDVAYGDQGHPPVIPGGATLIFVVELLEIVKADASKDAASPTKKN